jgi:hypothetical protein
LAQDECAADKRAIDKKLSDQAVVFHCSLQDFG